MMAEPGRVTDQAPVGNCIPGYRWTERDVGTSAISLCLARRLPIQLKKNDHFCKVAHDFCSSAAPVFGRDGVLLGVMVVSGEIGMVHPHTLAMVINAARSVERELRVQRRNRELALHVDFMDAVVEASRLGAMILDQDKRIWKMNSRCMEILGGDDLMGRHVGVLEGFDVDLKELDRFPGACENREYYLKTPNRHYHFLYTARPVRNARQKVIGALVSINEMGSVRKLADRIAGIRARFTFDNIIGDSKTLEEAKALARRASQGDVTVLLEGETGTGKELFSQSIHNAGPRRDHPFVPINCGAVPRELIESELFGYEEGAFTGAQKGGRQGKFELADGGTILLDEIGDMPPDIQVKLLRVLQTGEIFRVGGHKPIAVNVRIIASTHVNLREAVACKTFREDLFYRLNVWHISVPALRRRERDSVLLAEFFLKRYAAKSGITPPKLSPPAGQSIWRYAWPGNVRELENTILRALHFKEGDEITPEHLGLSEQVPGRAADTESERRPAEETECRTLEEMECRFIGDALSRNNFNMAKTARELGVARGTLYRKANRYGLAPS